MPNYPSSYSNTGPFSAGPVNNAQLYFDIHNRILKHNLISVSRIVQAQLNLTPIGGANASGSLSAYTYGFYDTNNYFTGLATGAVIAIVNQNATGTSITGPLGYNGIQNSYGAAINGIYVYSAGPTGVATGPSLFRVQSLANIVTAGPLTGLISGSTTAWANSTGTAVGFLNALMQPVGSSVGTGSFASSTGSQSSLFPIQTLIDEAGIAYPQGFIAFSGATTDNTGLGVNPSSNVGKIVYYTQEQLFSNAAYLATGSNYGSQGTGPNFMLGFAAVNFSSLQNLNLTYPTNYSDTDRNVYNTSTMGDFFINIRVASDLMQQILAFRSGNGADLSAAQQVYIANLKAQRILWIKTRLTFMLGDLYDLYKTFYTVLYNYSIATGSKGANTPSTFNRGYNIYRQN